MKRRDARSVERDSNAAEPVLATSFLCCALLGEGVGALREAGWNTLCAAWAADDEGAPEAARRYRVRAASLYERALAAGAIEREKARTIGCIRVDLLRRAGAFDEAPALCRQARMQETDDLRLQVLDYEDRLIVERDMEAHTLAEAGQTR